MLKYGYDQSSKRMALGIWIAVSTMLLGAMLLPLYWFWNRLIRGVLSDILALVGVAYLIRAFQKSGS
jgi:hypothetical protein